MHKNFKEWGLEKKRLHNLEKEPPLFNESEIWWCSLGVNVGQEQDGKNANFERPVLVFKKFNKNVLWMLPLSSKIKDGEYYSMVQYRNIKNSAILSQLRLISSKRLLRKIGVLPLEQYRKIEDGLIWLCIKRNPPGFREGISILPPFESHCD